MKGAVVYLAWQEFKANLRPARVVLLFSLAMASCFMVVRQPWEDSMAHLQGALSLFASSWLPYMIPIAAAAMSGSVAAERQRGVTLSILARGVSRSEYLGAKMLGASASGALLVLAEIVGFYVMVGIQWPLDAVSYEGTDFYPGPVPALFARSPLANDLLSAAMSIMAVVGLCLVGVAASTIIAHEYLAMTVPPLLVILGALLLRGVLQPLSPDGYLNVWSGYAGAMPPGLRAYAPFGYWLIVSTLAIGLGLRRFTKAEL